MASKEAAGAGDLRKRLELLFTDLTCYSVVANASIVNVLKSILKQEQSILLRGICASLLHDDRCDLQLSLINYLMVS